MMVSKRELMDQLNATYQQFRSTFEDLNEHEFDVKWLDRRWGVREIVAHHVGWLGQFAGGLERMSRGERPSPPGVDWTDVQHWNDIFAEHAMGKHKHEILNELEHALDAFREAAARVPDDRFGEGKTANKMSDRAGISHFREHTAMIRAWRSGQRATVASPSRRA